MRLWILSDLHVNFSSWYPSVVPEHDVVVVAGDVSERLSTIVVPWLGRTFGGDNPIIYVPGNHDFYGTHQPSEVRRAKERAAALPLLNILAVGEEIVIGDVRFVGATLWTDYRIVPELNQAALEAAREGLADHQFIEANGPLSWQPEDALREHLTQRARIEEILAEPFSGSTVVVSHHAPHPHSLQNGHWTELLDGAYASDLSDILEGSHAPALWIHGHIHKPRDYGVGFTRIVSNPRGYEWTELIHGRATKFVENERFNPAFVLNTDDLRSEIVTASTRSRVPVENREN